MHAAIQSEQHHLLIMLTFLQYSLLTSLSKIRWNVGGLIYMWVLNSTSLFNVSTFISVPCCLYYYSSVVQLNLRWWYLQKFPIVVRDYFGYHRLFVFPYENKGVFNFYKNWIWDLKWIFLNLYIAFVRTVMFTILLLPIHDYERYFYILVLSSIFY